jgi:hypothetical protein
MELDNSPCNSAVGRLKLHILMENIFMGKHDILKNSQVPYCDRGIKNYIIHRIFRERQLTANTCLSHQIFRERKENLFSKLNL